MLTGSEPEPQAQSSTEDGRRDSERYARRVKADYVAHWTVVLLVGLYAGQLHGIVAGLGTVVAIVLGIAITNTIILAATGSLVLVRINHWAWPIAAAVILAATSATICRVDQPC